MNVRLIAALVVALSVSAVGARQQTPAPATQTAASPAEAPAQEQPLPRFRGGANLVRVDAYVTQNGTPLTDLTMSDFEVVEDSAPQRVETFELVRPRGPADQNARNEPNTVAEARAMASDPDARLFVLFMDVWHVHIAGSHNIRKPIINLLDRAIGQDDMVGVMTPEMSARNLTLARRTTTIEGLLTDNWFWGERDRLNSSDPREQEFETCYPEIQYPGIALEMKERRRERKTLDAIQDLIVHLEGLREERKFVVMLSEGWLLPGRNDALARVLKVGTQDYIPGRDPIGAGPDGKLTRNDPRMPSNFEQCERERNRLAAEDLRSDFEFLLQRANRANTSFYTVDPRGLVAFDEDISVRRAMSPVGDAARLRTRQDALRNLAENTDGVAILNTNNLTGALERIVADTGAYYLLGYYSTNTRLDGKFRKLTVRVKRPGVDVRARPGYLAPTEAEMASARVDALMNGAPPGHSTMPPGVARALDCLAPARGAVPLRVQAAAGAGHVWVTGELDAATLKLPEWAKGGQALVTLEHERGSVSPLRANVTLEPGQRAFSVSQPQDGALAPGRYVLRLQVTAADSTLPLQTTADVAVLDTGDVLSQTGVAARRGPSTGLQYQPTADARYRRTERLRLEVPRVASGGTVSARLLGREGTPLPLTIALSEREDPHGKMIVADLTLAPLAQGEYVIEVTLDKDGKKESATYGFRIVP